MMETPTRQAGDARVNGPVPSIYDEGEGSPTSISAPLHAVPPRAPLPDGACAVAVLQERQAANRVAATRDKYRAPLSAAKSRAEHAASLHGARLEMERAAREMERGGVRLTSLPALEREPGADGACSPRAAANRVAAARDKYRTAPTVAQSRAEHAASLEGARLEMERELYRMESDAAAAADSPPASPRTPSGGWRASSLSSSVKRASGLLVPRWNSK
jgi:hypothetical protein